MKNAAIKFIIEKFCNISTYLSYFLVFLSYLVELVLNLVFEFDHELSLNITYSHFAKFFHCCSFCFLVDFSELIIKNR